jgi:hypothetical protein
MGFKIVGNLLQILSNNHGNGRDTRNKRSSTHRTKKTVSKSRRTRTTNRRRG